MKDTSIFIEREREREREREHARARMFKSYGLEFRVQVLGGESLGGESLGFSI
jgi:hypothetical protein